MTLTHIIHDWAVRCFGREHVQNRAVRILRLVEEAVELAQAGGIPQKKIAKLVEIVYERPPGNVIQEIAGVLMTVNVLCGTLGLDPDDILLAEVRRVLGKPPSHFAQRNAEKVAQGLDA